MIDRQNYTVLTHCMQIISWLRGLVVAICCEVERAISNPSFDITSIAFEPSAALLRCYRLHCHLHLVVGSIPACSTPRELVPNAQ